MISVACPICGEGLSGRYELDLEQALQVHMRSRHDVQDLCILDEHGHPEGSIQECQPEVVRQAEGIPREGHDRPVFEYSTIDQIKHMLPSLPEESIPEERMVRIRCSLCGEEVDGTDGDDLSRQLRSHFLSTHPSRLEMKEERRRGSRD